MTIHTTITVINRSNDSIVDAAESHYGLAIDLVRQFQRRYGGWENADTYEVRVERKVIRETNYYPD